MSQESVVDLVHVPRRIVLKCAHTCSGAEVVDKAFVEETGGSRAFMYFHSANRVCGHKTYLPAEFSGGEAARIQRAMFFGSIALRTRSCPVQARVARFVKIYVRPE
jgi:hypothetical protein